MDKMQIPANPNWFMQSIFYCLGDRAVLYGAMSQVVYVPAEPIEEISEIRTFDIKNKLLGLSPHPDWEETKVFAVINADFTVLLFDFATGSSTIGHKGHDTGEKVIDKSKQACTAIVYLKQNVVITSVCGNVVHYCVDSNTYQMYLGFTPKSNPISIFRQSPEEPNLVAAGTKNGLILIIRVDKMEVIVNLRGHDTEISSLDWIYLTMKPSPLNETEKAAIMEEACTAAVLEDAGKALTLEETDKASTLTESDKAAPSEAVDIVATLSEVVEAFILKENDKGSIPEAVDEASDLGVVDKTAMTEALDKSSSPKEDEKAATLEGDSATTSKEAEKAAIVNDVYKADTSKEAATLESGKVLASKAVAIATSSKAAYKASPSRAPAKMTPSKKVCKKTSILQQMIDSTDASDAFDVYKDSSEREFGVYDGGVDDGSDDEEDNNASSYIEKLGNDSNFDFLEECKALKNHILVDDTVGGDQSKTTFEDNKDQYGVKNTDDASEDDEDDSVLSNASSNTPNLTEESLNYLEEAERASRDIFVQEYQIPVLASGSRDQNVWIWDVNDRTPFAHVTWHPLKRSILPIPFTNVLWADENTLLITNGNGDIIEHKVTLDSNKRSLTTKEQKDRKVDVKGVLNMCKSDDGVIIWTSSIHRNISCLEIQGDYAKIVSLDTMQQRVHCITENPSDPNLIALSGNDKRVCLWNTSTANVSTIKLRPFMNKIHSCILCVAWHPEQENLLALSTREGRVATLDVSKHSNVPSILKSIGSEEVYSLTWAKLKDSFVLFACNKSRFVYFSGKDHNTANYVNSIKDVASVAAKGKLLAVGTQNGNLLFADLCNNLRVLATRKISNKYVGMMSWHGESTLAISTESGIFIIRNITSDISEIRDRNVVNMIGHNGRVFSVRFNKAGNFLVSCCQSGFVKVWDLKMHATVATVNIETPALSGIFWPNNENFVIIGSQDSTPFILNWRDFEGKSEIEDAPKKKPSPYKHVNWAIKTEVIQISKNGQKRVKVKIEPENGDTGKVAAKPKKKKNSIFDLADRELNIVSLSLTKSILSDDLHSPGLNEKMFGSRDQVMSLISKECSDNVGSKNSHTVFLSQLDDKLKEDIEQRTVKKTLTEVHVAAAPSVSFDFWSKTCKAFATQCIESGDSLSAITYFLAVNDVDHIIEHLCEIKLFREAFVIAKMRKEAENPIFTSIVDRWTGHLNHIGNFEASATILVCFGNFRKAAETLQRRQDKDALCIEVIQLLESKTIS